jgi:two-component system, sensor histidine kinase YesM
MKTFGDFRIRNQINLIVCVAAALLVLTMGAVYVAFDAIMTRAAVERFHDLAERSGKSVQSTLRSIEANERNYAFILEKSGFPDFPDTQVDMARYVADSYATMSAISDDMKSVILVSTESAPVTAGVDANAMAVLANLVRQPEFVNMTVVRSYFTKAIQGPEPNLQYFAHVTPIMASSGTGRAEGYLISLFDYTTVRDVLETLAGGDPRNLGLILEGDRVLVPTSDLTTEERGQMVEIFTAKADEAAASKNTRKYVKYRGKSALVLSAQIPESDWTLAVLVSRAVIKAPIVLMVWVGLGILLAGVAILTVASVATIRAITRPVEGIVRSMESVGSSREYHEIATPVNNEVGVMATHINNMVHKLEEADRRTHEAEKRLYEMDLARMRTELSYYQSQINPHFLYNTLESIRSMAMVHDAEEIGALAVATAGIFRYAVRSDQVVKLRDELTCVGEYMTIMQTRFPGRYSLRLGVPEECLDLPIYRMLLQPIVENCFKHGFAGKSGSGRIHIGAAIQADGCRISIADNGKGMSPEELERLRILLAEKTDTRPVSRESSNERAVLSESADSQPVLKVSADARTDQNAASNAQTVLKASVDVQGNSTSGTRVGLLNTHRRLQLGYGGMYGLKVDSREGFWTRVTLLVPAHAEDD